MKDAQKPERFSLGSLIDKLREGRFCIPDFQREFEWEPKDVRDLMRSIFLDYYIGTLLLWKGKPENFKALSCASIYGFTGESDPEFIALDGQQRLTAIYYTCFGPAINFPRRKNPISFYVNIRDFMEERPDVAFSYHAKNLKKWQEMLADRKKQFEAHIFPLDVVGAGRFAVPNWMQDYERFWQDRAGTFADDGLGDKAATATNFARDAREFGELVCGLIQDYQVSYIELDKDIGLDKVCDIFTQINSRGMPLDVFDLLNAMLRPKQIYLRKMWREAKPRLAFVESKKANVYVLQVMSILLQAYNSPRYLYFMLPEQEKPIRRADGSHDKTILIKDNKDFEQRWEEAVAGLESTIGVLKNPREYGAIAPVFIPYPAILPVFAALRMRSQSLSDGSSLDRQNKIRRWYWASIFTNRYGGSVDSTAARDFQDLTAWFNDDDAEPGVIRTFAARFKDLDLHSEKRKGAAVYNGIFNLLVIRGARDWNTFELPESEMLDDHHIVPISKAPTGVPDGLINSILNRTPLASATNRQVIHDRLPSKYLKEMIDTHGKEAVVELMETHLISEKAIDLLLRDPLTAVDFNEFLEERKRFILVAIEDLLIKRRVGLSAPLRDLDERIERIELLLRACLVETLGEDVTVLPGNLVQKANEKISREGHNNPLFDEGAYEPLSRRLEYFDLRELQDVIINKALWPRFQDRFGTVNNLSQRFDQLAKLRNSIRHSRAVTDLIRTDGEAAIMWFAGVLGLESQRARA